MTASQWRPERPRFFHFNVVYVSGRRGAELTFAAKLMAVFIDLIYADE